MKSLVVYESFFGNTKMIAEAIATSLKASLIQASEFTTKDLTGVKLLVMGSPTRGFRPSPNTSALLTTLEPDALKDIQIAAFDTRMDPNDVKSKAGRLFLKGAMAIFRGGYAADSIYKQLKDKGGKITIEPTGFYVLDSGGPLRNGEMERASKFAKKIISNQ